MLEGEVLLVKENIERSRRLGLYMHKRFPSVDSDECVSLANEALVKLAQRFDASKHPSFKTYLGSNWVSTIIDLLRTQLKYRTKTSYNTVPLFIGGDGEYTIHSDYDSDSKRSYISTEDQYSDPYDIVILNKLLAKLSKRDKDIILDLCNMNMKQVASKWNLTEARISQIKTKLQKQLELNMQ